MKAMVCVEPGATLELQDVPVPVPGPGQVQVRVLACGVCRTDLHIVDGDLPLPRLPVIPGHQIVGEVSALGPDARRWSVGQRLGIPWMGSSCGRCRYCNENHENLCDLAGYTGYHHDGGFAQYAVANEDYCFEVDPRFDAVQAAPLLCAGLIGYRAYRFAGTSATTVGFYGFGAAAHILIQVAKAAGQRVFAFTRAGDDDAQALALKLGAEWSGDSTMAAPEALDAAIIFAPAGELVPVALQAVRKGGRVVCAGIHMSDIPQFPYKWLWGERSILSVANLTRHDAELFLPVAAQIPVRTQTTVYPLSEANRALDDLRSGKITGAAVIVP
jgi:propanol-preferring alcohol dehydrogenase